MGCGMSMIEPNVEQDSIASREYGFVGSNDDAHWVHYAHMRVYGACTG